MDSPPLPEPWMRGPIADVAPHLMPIFHSFMQVREDLAQHTAGLTSAQVWKRVGTLPSVGFHLRHIAGSVDRLVTYLMGGELTADQMGFLKSEQAPGATLDELLRAVTASLEDAERRISTIPESALDEPRHIGRKRLPATVLGLLVHIAEHTQRHLGQVITTAKLVRAGE